MSASILHGRRKGQDRPLSNTQAGQPAMRDAQDLRQVKVLTRDDWNRIQLQLNKRNLEQEKLKAEREEKDRLHQLSKERAKNWTNTFVGQRQKKLEARQIREDQDEDERKVVDIEEFKYQAERRKESIEKAKTQQYYQTDRVKGFHGALLLTEVLKERDAQVELKALKAKSGDGQDNQWVVSAQRDHEEAILRDQEEARERIRRTRDNAEFQKAQINLHLRQKQRVADGLQIEGEELKQLSAQYDNEKKRLGEIRHAEADHMMQDNLRQIANVKKMKDIQRRQEEEEDEECRIFAAAKRKMMKMRGDKEHQLHNEKQEKLETIRQKLGAQMQQKVDDESDRITRASQEAEEKRAAEEAKKEEYNQKMLREIAEHRHQDMLDKEYRAGNDRRKEMEILAVRQEADDLFARNEMEKQRRKHDGMKGLQDYLQAQVDDRKVKAKLSREEQLEMDRRNQEVVQLEEQQFTEYSRRVIEHCEKGGRNTYPLQKAAKEGAGGGLGPVFPGKGGVRPSYMVSDQSGVQMPHYQRDSTEDTKEDVNGTAPTNKRLGFVW